MKIQLVSSSSGSRGGGEFYLHSLALGLKDLGHEVTTLMSTHSQMDELAKRFEKTSLSVTRWPYKNTYHRRLRSIQAAFAKKEIGRCIEAFSHNAPDIIHINQQCLEDGLDLVQAASQCQIPATSTIHVTKTMVELKAIGGWFRDRLAKQVLRQSKLDLIGISHTAAVGLSQFVNASSELIDPANCEKGSTAKFFHCPVYSVPNGVSIPNIKKRQQLRSSWNIPKNAIVLGAVGRIEKEKNPHFVIPLMKILPSHVHFVWLGDGREMASFKNAVQAEGLESRIHLKGWTPDASAYLSGFDIFILPSFYEGLSLALLEAMAIGLPAVASDIYGMGDAIDDGKSGYLCPVNDISSWTSTLQRLIESPELRAKIGQAALLKYHNQFSLQAMAERTVAVYEDVISKHKEKA
ncbi:MAG: glycosyltransferase family 4 protein [Gimesia sp.]